MDFSDKTANVGDLVNWMSMINGTRQGVVTSATAKTVKVQFKASKYNEAETVTLKRVFPVFGQLKGRFDQFGITTKVFVGEDN